jgi:hypothetical protein
MPRKRRLLSAKRRLPPSKRKNIIEETLGRQRLPRIGAARYHIGNVARPENAERVAELLAGAPFFLPVEVRHCSLYYIGEHDCTVPLEVASTVVSVELTETLRQFVLAADKLRVLRFANPVNSSPGGKFP